MLTAASLLYVNNMISLEGLLISVIAMMSSFGPVVALANLGSFKMPKKYILQQATAYWIFWKKHLDKKILRENRKYHLQDAGRKM